jgi:hypothetical protein
MNRLILRSWLPQCAMAGLFLLLLPGCLPLQEVKVSSAQILTGSTQPRLKHKFATIPFETQAEEVALLLQQNRFTEIEQIIDQHIQHQTATHGGFYYPDIIFRQLFTEEIISIDSRLEQRLTQWVQTSPNSTTALITRSTFYYYYAWQARGNGYNATIPKPAKEEFLRRLALSSQDFESAYELEPDNPLVLIMALELSKFSGTTKKGFEEYFDAATARIPYMAQAYQQKMNFLRPQWHGSDLKMLNFVRQSAASAPRGSTIPLFVAHAHASIAQRNISNKTYYNRPDVWADIEASYTRLIEDFPATAIYPAQYAEVAADVGNFNLAQRMIQIAQAREPNHPVVQRISAKVEGLNKLHHSLKRLEKHSGQNSEVMRP